MENVSAAKSLWKEVLDYLSIHLEIIILDVWFKPLEPLYIKDNVLYLASLTQSNIDQINEYMSDINDALCNIGSTVSTIKIVFKKNEKIIEYETPLATAEKKIISSQPTMFNAKYTFDNFVVGSSNRFVHAAARSVADNPGSNYNPLFIYGGVGLGKTHLIQAIGNHLLLSKPDLNIMYVTSEKFMNDFIDSLHGGNTKGDGINSSFRQKYRNVDVLMVDDIQFYKKSADSTQEQFFHTFNDLYNQNKQIIITSDRQPKELKDLEDRLRSRFECGLIADIKPPDIETKIAILKKKAELQKCNLPQNVLNLIAERPSTNIRDLEGMLTRVIFFASLQNTKVTMDLAIESLKDIADEAKENIDIDRIINVVCSYYNVQPTELMGKKKTKGIVDPRQNCIYIITNLLSLPLSTIAEKFNRDHTTIIHARDKITENIKKDNRLKNEINDIESLIKNS